ncbi:MAG TPA: TrkA family potassium uptake protein [Flavobacteriaceae bacterium]|nr:TrkA family potassium uptake protein [Flavobacteriaceae bacterium]
MKIIIFGLGNFGSSLSVHLADSGNEVVVADKNPEKINLIKDKVSHAVVMDSTNENAYRALPVKNTDIAIISISADEGAAIMTTAIVKHTIDCKIFARSSSSIQDRIFEAMGVDQIIHPEQEYAEQLTKKINLKGSIDNFEIEGDYLVSEIEVGKDLVGKTIIESKLREKYHLNVITIIRKKQYSNLIGRRADKQEVLGMVKPDTVFKAGDILVVFGKTSSIDKYLKLTVKESN